MDSKNIFIACSVMLRKAEWEKPKNQNEWSFVGDGDGFQVDNVQCNIETFFDEENLYLVTDRHKSKEIKKMNAAKEVKTLLLNNKGVSTLFGKKYRWGQVFP